MDAQAQEGRRQEPNNQAWEAAVKLYRDDKIEEAIGGFKHAGTSAKLHFNLGISYAKLEKFRVSIDHFDKAISSDQYLAVAYFARGTVHYQCYGYEAASQDFTEALNLCNINDRIDYRPLGLSFTLLRADIFFNRAMCQMKTRRYEKAQADMIMARRGYSDKKKRRHISNVLRKLQDIMEGGTRIDMPTIIVGEDDTGEAVERKPLKLRLHLAIEQFKSGPVKQTELTIPKKAPTLSDFETTEVAEHSGSKIVDLFIEAKKLVSLPAEFLRSLPPIPEKTIMPFNAQDGSACIRAAMTVDQVIAPTVRSPIGESVSATDSYGTPPTTSSSAGSTPTGSDKPAKRRSVLRASTSFPALSLGLSSSSNLANTHTESSVFEEGANTDQDLDRDFELKYGDLLKRELPELPSDVKIEINRDQSESASDTAAVKDNPIATLWEYFPEDEMYYHDQDRERGGTEALFMEIIPLFRPARQRPVPHHPHSGSKTVSESNSGLSSHPSIPKVVVNGDENGVEHGLGILSSASEAALPGERSLSQSHSNTSSSTSVKSSGMGSRAMSLPAKAHCRIGDEAGQKEEDGGHHTDDKNFDFTDTDGMEETKYPDTNPSSCVTPMDITEDFSDLASTPAPKVETESTTAGCSGGASVTAATSSTPTNMTTPTTMTHADSNGSSAIASPSVGTPTTPHSFFLDESSESDDNASIASLSTVGGGSEDSDALPPLHHRVRLMSETDSNAAPTPPPPDVVIPGIPHSPQVAHRSANSAETLTTVNKRERTYTLPPEPADITPEDRSATVQVVLPPPPE